MAGLESNNKQKYMQEPHQTNDTEYRPNTSIDKNIEFEISFSKAQEAYINKNENEAKRLYFLCIQQSAFNKLKLFECYKNLGNIFVREGDLDAAEELYNKAYTLNSESDILLVNLGTLEIQRSNFEKALQRYRRAVELNKNNDRAWVGLALVHREYGDINLSWGNLEKSLDSNPTSETSLELLVQWGVKDSRFDCVISRLEHYLSLKPKSHYAYKLLTRTLIVNGRFQTAIEVLLECKEFIGLDEELNEIQNIINENMSTGMAAK